MPAQCGLATRQGDRTMSKLADVQLYPALNRAGPAWLSLGPVGWCLFNSSRNTPDQSCLAAPLPLSSCRALLQGMLYLHGHKPQPIIHRDLKSPNLLVTKDWRVKVRCLGRGIDVPVLTSRSGQMPEAIRLSISRLLPYSAFVPGCSRSTLPR